MRNLKHTIAAIAAVSLVGSLAIVQASEFATVKATRLAQEPKTVISTPAILPGDGDGITPEFTISPARQLFVGKTGYILTDGGSINLRAAADTESTILDVLSLGTEIKIIDVDEEWFKIKAGDFEGYIKSEFVTLDYEKVKKVMLATTMFQNGTATKSINIHGTADENSLILDFLGEGAKVTILETTENGWHKIYFGDNYDIGYVSAEYITIGDMIERDGLLAKRSSRIAAIAKNAKIKTSEQSVDVKLLPNADSETLTTLENKASCKIISGGKNWTKIIVPSSNEIGYVRTSQVEEIVPPAPKTVKKNTKAGKSSASAQAAAEAPVVGSGNGAQLVAQAAKYIGTRYVYGGTSPSGFDCSGLVQYCLRKMGVSISRSSGSQYGHGTAVSRSNLQPGDLVFFARGKGISHVAIYAGNDQVIHAPRAGKSVCYQSLSTLSKAMKYVGAKRVL